MNESFDAVDEVLHVLRDVDVPVGMEQRVLARMERAAVRPHGWSMPRRLAVAGGLLFSIVFAGVVFHFVSLRREAVAITTVERLLNSVVAMKESGRALRDIPPFVAKSATKNGAPAEVTPAKVASVNMASPGQGDLRNKSASLRGGVAEEASIGPILEPPLTEEERLLLRIVQKGDPVMMAALNPEERTRVLVRERAEFKEFFRTDLTVMGGGNE